MSKILKVIAVGIVGVACMVVAAMLLPSFMHVPAGFVLGNLCTNIWLLILGSNA